MLNCDCGGVGGVPGELTLLYKNDLPTDKESLLSPGRFLTTCSASSYSACSAYQERRPFCLSEITFRGFCSVCFKSVVFAYAACVRSHVKVGKTM